MIPLWKKYFFSEICKVFFFFLFGFFFLYSLIEYSMHMDDFFKDHSLQIREIVLYYINQFLLRLDFLLPMALLLSCIKVLTSLVVRNEWTVLQAAGLSSRKLLRPFFLVSCLCTFLCYANFEYFYPSALRHIDEFRVSHFGKSHLTQRRELIHMIPLKDNTKLIYQTYLKEKNLLFDVLWIKSNDDIWRIKFLSGDPANPDAEYVDHIVRNAAGLLEKTESYQKVRLNELKWHPRMARQSLIPFEQRSISELFRFLFRSKMTPYETPKVKTSLLFKIGIPWISPLLILAIVPFCIVFKRGRQFFALYALAIFGLFALYMFLDSLSILSDHGVVSPVIGLLAPLGILAAFFTWRFRQKIA